MLKIHVPKGRFFKNQTNEFFYTEETDLELEHSLISLSKWESKWHKPFLDKKEKTEEELLDYIRCMTISKNVDPKVYYALDEDALIRIKAYIDDPMTATWFAEDKSRRRGPQEVITAEIIYYWMIAQNIPVQFEKWHLNRLLTLIRVCGIKNAPPKKMKRSQIHQQNHSLNAARRAARHSRG